MAGQQKAEKSKGGFLGNISNSLFRQVKDVVIDIQSGAMGVKQKNDESGDVLATVNADGELVHNPIKQLGLPVPGIAIRTPVADLKAGDIIVMPDGGYSFNLGPAENGNLKIVNAKSGRATDFNPAKNTLLGNNGVMAVRNFLNLGGGGGGGGLLGNPLMLMLLLGNKDGEGDGGLGGLDKNTLLLLMLSGGLGGGQQAPAAEGNNLLSNPLMLMLLLGNKDGDDEDDDGPFGGGMLKTMLMMQMMGGCGGGLGAAALFGGLGGSSKKCCKTADPVS
jgi:hypothetical protein